MLLFTAYSEKPEEGTQIIDLEDTPSTYRETSQGTPFDFFDLFVLNNLEYSFRTG